VAARRHLVEEAAGDLAHRAVAADRRRAGLVEHYEPFAADRIAVSPAASACW
jgi:hypothetical protein